MAKRTHYRIIVEFTYKNGLAGGKLDYTVNSKAAIERQMEANRKWLKAKGHTIDSIDIQPIN